VLTRLICRSSPRVPQRENAPHYAFGQDDAWTASVDTLWLSFLPAAAVVVGALILVASANRAGAGIGAWLALAGGVWFVVGPTFSLLWDAGGPAAPIGRPLGDEGLRVTELLWSFYTLGALITARAAFALGRLATVSVRDLDAARAICGFAATSARRSAPDVASRLPDACTRPAPCRSQPADGLGGSPRNTGSATACAAAEGSFSSCLGSSSAPRCCRA
jgi:hypothetical protein